jgi:hypothetical protein
VLVQVHRRAPFLNQEKIMTALASKFKQRKWTKVKLPQTYLDLLIDALIDSVVGKYGIIPEFNRGYDDPLTKEIYFELASDAQAFEALLKTIIDPADFDDEEEEFEPVERSIFYHDED